MGGGVLAGSAFQSGSRSRTRAIVSEILLAGERRLPCEHFEEHAAERPDVGALVDGLAPVPAQGSCTPRVPRITPACVIAGEVNVGEFDSPAPSLLATGSIAFASPKSSTFTVPSARHLDVGGLQIAMDDALLVRRFECFGDLPRDRQRLVRAGSARARCGPPASARRPTP